MVGVVWAIIGMRSERAACLSWRGITNGVRKEWSKSTASSAYGAAAAAFWKKTAMLTNVGSYGVDTINFMCLVK
jgi:hypothetical protein